MIPFGENEFATAAFFISAPFHKDAVIFHFVLTCADPYFKNITEEDHGTGAWETGDRFQSFKKIPFCVSAGEMSIGDHDICLTDIFHNVDNISRFL